MVLAKRRIINFYFSSFSFLFLITIISSESILRASEPVPIGRAVGFTSVNCLNLAEILRKIRSGDFTTPHLAQLGSREVLAPLAEVIRRPNLNSDRIQNILTRVANGESDVVVNHDVLRAITTNNPDGLQGLFLTVGGRINLAGERALSNTIFNFRIIEITSENGQQFLTLQNLNNNTFSSLVGSQGVNQDLNIFRININDLLNSSEDGLMRLTRNDPITSNFEFRRPTDPSANSSPISPSAIDLTRNSHPPPPVANLDNSLATDDTFVLTVDTLVDSSQTVRPPAGNISLSSITETFGSRVVQFRGREIQINFGRYPYSPVRSSPEEIMMNQFNLTREEARSLFLGRGGQRMVYRHPHDENLVIKIFNNAEHSPEQIQRMISRDLAYERFMQETGVDFYGYERGTGDQGQRIFEDQLTQGILIQRRYDPSQTLSADEIFSQRQNLQTRQAIFNYIDYVNESRAALSPAEMDVFGIFTGGQPATPQGTRAMIPHGIDPGGGGLDNFRIINGRLYIVDW